ncbi:MAG: hypothetical protein HKN79_07625 [Flavobacteriales bacterium]|nr:hypothetical protein [Flavobacteriales bacterium]
MLRILLSILAGVFAGGIAVAILEVWLMDLLFDMPDSMIPDDPESVAAHIEIIPTGAKWLVVLAQGVGAFVATWVAARVSQDNRKAAMTAGIIICVFTVMNLFMIPHPAWMSVAMPLVAILGLVFGLRNTA